MRKRLIFPFFIVFTLSGFSGLIYESIWTHYLKLFLGHAAYAQALVLAIFMGGLALGSGICSRYSSRWNRPFLSYALAECVIGLFALVFHSVFDQSIQFSYASVLPHLHSPAMAYAYKWALSALLILPQSILLGMTFPLMSAGILRLTPQKPGRVVSLLYFTNSLGAVIGVLASGFVLIRLIGLPWTIRLAGLVNIALALTVVALVGDREKVSPKVVSTTAVECKEPRSRLSRLLLLVALITGASSFMYEIGWIRMLSLVLGSSTHSFELMLSAFILGLACGSLWIQRVIDRVEIPERYLAYAQVAMGFLALLTLMFYGQTFNVMKWLMHNLEKSNSGYFAFNLASNGIALAIMLPATFCAGMTLPLITAIMLKRGNGERSIGAVYAANTLGAILGVLLAIHLGLPFLGLKGLIAFGATCDVALGVLLLWKYAQHEPKRPWLVTAVAWGVSLAVILPGVTFDPYKMASGVYRTGMFLYPQLMEITSHQDGKTATISTYTEKATGFVAIATNGKSDAALGLDLNGPVATDEPTMILAAVLPMAFHPSAKTAANIGLGSGLTTQTLLANPGMQRVDTIEIEKAVVDAGKFFLPRVPAVYRDPRSRIMVDDAKTFFSVHQKKYDIIVSEPSNPWVSGVSGLFSEEFYDLILQHLDPQGVFVQWVQLYEIDNELVLSILKTLSNSFSDYSVFSTNDRDLVIVAKKQGSLPTLNADILKFPTIYTPLQRIDVKTIQDINIRKIGNKKLFEKLLNSPEIKINSDYFPIVDQNAAQARFMGQNAFDFIHLFNDTAPLMEMLAGEPLVHGSTQITQSQHLSRSQVENTAMSLRDLCLRVNASNTEGVSPEIASLADDFLQLFNNPNSAPDPMARQITLYNGLIKMVPYLRPQEMEAVWIKLESGKAASRLSWQERNWVVFFKSISRREPKAMATSAASILASRQRMPREVLEFVVATGLVGNLLQGDSSSAHRLWMATRVLLFNSDPPDLLFRLLAAECTTP